jgi:hypothetical protein
LGFEVEGFWVLGSGFWILGLEFAGRVPGHSSSDIFLLLLGHTWFRVWGSGVRVSGWGVRCRLSGFELWPWDSVFWVQGSGFRVQGLRFRISGFGLIRDGAGAVFHARAVEGRLDVARLHVVDGHERLTRSTVISTYA